MGIDAIRATGFNLDQKNPNLLWDVQADALAVIDHNLAFDPDFDSGRFAELQVFADQWNEVLGDFERQSSYVRRLQNLLETLPTLRASIPDAWWWVDDGVAAAITWDAIRSCLDRCNRPGFWNLT